MTEQSDQMMLLLEELAALKKAQENGEKNPITRKRRREITQEMKRLASETKNALNQE